MKYVKYICSLLLLVAVQTYAQDKYGYFIEGLETLSGVTVYADGKECFTELIEVPTPKAPDITPREINFVSRVGEYLGDVQRIAITRFNPASHCSEIEIRLSGPAEKCKVSPENSVYGLSGLGSDVIRFNMPSCSYAYVEIDDLPPLVVSSERQVEMAYSRKKSDVHYYGPGVHEVGMMEPKSGDVIFIDKGAIVYGSVKMKDCHNVVIAGNGILDTGHEGKGSAIHFENCSDVRIEGLNIRSSKGGWMVVPTRCTNLTIKDIKIFGFGTNNDCIDLVSCSDVNISGCFFRSTDDCIALKTGVSMASRRIYISDSVFYGFASSDGVVVGYEARNAIDSVFVRNCDILASRGTSPTGGKAPFSVICDGPGPISNICFENCRIADNVDFKNLEVSVTNGAQYVNMAPGKVENVVFRNVHWAKADMPFLIWGHSNDNKVTNVLFENCTVGGKPLQNHQDAVLVVNRYTDLIQFRYAGEEKMFRRF